MEIRAYVIPVMGVFLSMLTANIIFSQNNDCVNAEVICSDGPVNYNPQGPGNWDFDPSQTTCGTTEHQSAWYYFEFDNTMPPGSILEFDIVPDDGFTDFDFAIFGPDVSCGNLGTSIRCDFDPSGFTGLEEGSTGAGPYEPALIVNPGQGFYLLVDNFSTNGSPFSMTWGGSAAQYLDCDATPGCDISVDAGTDISVCHDEVFTLSATYSGEQGAPTIGWTAVPPSAQGYINSPGQQTTTVSIPPGEPGPVQFAFSVTDTVCTRTDTVEVMITPSTSPTFNISFEICETAEPLILPDVSSNGFTGSWNPATLDPAGQGGTTLDAVFTIDPDQDNCLESETFTFTITEAITPTFNIPGELCETGGSFVFPSTSSEGIAGSWNPATINPAGQGGQTITAQFTPGSDDCAEGITVDINVLDAQTPTFDIPSNLCENEDPFNLPNASMEGWTGIWDLPIIDPEGQGGNVISSTFVPDPDQGACLEQVTIDIVIDDLQMAIFDPFPTLCELDDPYTLPTSTPDGQYFGTWSVPVIDPAGQGGSTVTSVFTLDPGFGSCVEQTTANIEIEAEEFPVFDPVTLCELDDPFTLPTTSVNGITGTWVPAVIDPQNQGGNTVTAIFTPEATFCASDFQLDVNITEGDVPGFNNLVGTLCEFGDPYTLPNISDNGIEGSWDIPVVDPEGNGGQTIVTTFSPDPAQYDCASIYIHAVEITPGVIPTFDQIPPICENEAPVVPPSTSNNGISGIWDPASIDPAGSGGEVITINFTPDAGSCASSVSMDVVIIAEPVINNIDATDPGDCGTVDGSIVVDATGVDLEYSIDGGANWQSSPVFSGLDGGNYSVLVRSTQNTNCETSETVVLTSPGAPSIQQVITSDPTDCGSSDGSITIDATGTELEYSIDGGDSWQASPDFTDLSEGNYIVQVRVASSPSCLATSTAILTGPPATEIAELIANDVTGCQANDGSIVVTATGENLEFSIDGGATWQTEDVFGGLTEGTYSVLARSSTALNCTDEAAATIEGPVPATIDDIAATDPTDCGVEDGIITVTASPQGAVLEYSIDGGASWQESEVFPGLTDGTYNVQVRIQGTEDCASGIQDVVLTAPETPVIDNIQTTPLTDCGEEDATALIEASGSGTLEYSIDNGDNWQAGNEFTGLAAGSYTVLVRVVGGTSCITTDMFNIASQNAPVIDTVIAMDVSDCGIEDGSIEIQASGDSLQYSIDGGANWQTENIFNGLASGNYDIQLRFAYATNCISTATAGITAPSQPVIETLVANNPSDCGLEDGSIEVTATGDSLEYSINGGTDFLGSGLFTGLDGGAYAIVVRETGSANCAVEDSVTLESLSSPEITGLDLGQPSDCGVQDASVVITASGGGALEYSVNGGNDWQSENSFTGLGAGQFTALVRNVGTEFCVDDSTFNISSQNDPVIDDVLVTDVSDCGLTDGSIAVTASGDMLEYSIDGGANWQTSGSFNGLDSGNYQVLVRAANATNCISETEINIDAPQSPVISGVNATDVSDCDLQDGTITVTASGGTLEYSIDSGANWQNNNSFTGLTEGSYEIVVRLANANSCIASATAQITRPIEPQITDIQAVDPTDCGLQNGQILVTAEGDDPEFSIDGDAWQKDSLFSGLGAGQYQISVRESNRPGCTDSESAELEAPDQPSIDEIQIDSVSDCGMDDATVTVLAQGDMLEYSIDGGANWQTENTFSPVAAGSYELQVREVNRPACMDATTIEIEDPDCACGDIAVGIIATDVNCADVADGTASLDISNVTTFEVDWSNGLSGEQIDGLPGGNYQFTITYDNNCSYTDSVSITEPEPLSFDINTGDVDCPDAANGYVEIENVSGGSGGYEYALNGSPFVPENFFDGLEEGSYTVAIRDANGCELEESINITEGSPLDVILPQEVNADFGELIELRPELELDRADGFEWDGNNIDSIDEQSFAAYVVAVETGVYTLTVFYGECSVTRTVTIRVDRQTVYIPNAFSPNDDGTNDAFYVYADESLTGLPYDMEIYNRWGDRVYEVRDAAVNRRDFGWDGSWKGEELQPGVYTYYVILKGLNGEEVLRKGDVTLVQ